MHRAAFGVPNDGHYINHKESNTMKVISKNELLKFCDRLESHREDIDVYHDGHLEKEVSRAKEETINKIGDLLREFLESEEIQ